MLSMFRKKVSGIECTGAWIQNMKILFGHFHMALH